MNVFVRTGWALVLGIVCFGCADGNAVGSTEPFQQSSGQVVNLPVSQDKVQLLWPDGAPMMHGNDAADVPSVTVYQPQKPNGAGIVIYPGGAYQFLSDHEGEAYGKYFAHHGLTSFVVRYRLRSRGFEFGTIRADAFRAMRWVRAHSEAYGIKPDKIGAIGSSAGGHLVALLATQFDGGDPKASDPVDRVSSRPNFAVLCYAPVAFGPGKPMASAEWVLGPNASADAVRNISAVDFVRKDTPPCFLFHTEDDNLVSPENSKLFANSLKAKGVAHELFLYPNGGHGVGLGGSPDADTPHPWTVKLMEWMKKGGWVE